ncbi:unnamed protein product [Closterium sp. Naga37s-1]|nr:unnamed protein product [Closterium sp. Naga37s-1]
MLLFSAMLFLLSSAIPSLSLNSVRRMAVKDVWLLQLNLLSFFLLSSSQFHPMLSQVCSLILAFLAWALTATALFWERKRMAVKGAWLLRFAVLYVMVGQLAKLRFVLILQQDFQARAPTPTPHPPSPFRCISFVREFAWNASGAPRPARTLLLPQPAPSLLPACSPFFPFLPPYLHPQVLLGLLALFFFPNLLPQEHPSPGLSSSSALAAAEAEAAAPFLPPAAAAAGAAGSGGGGAGYVPLAAGPVGGAEGEAAEAEGGDNQGQVCPEDHTSFINRTPAPFSFPRSVLTSPMDGTVLQHLNWSDVWLDDASHGHGVPRFEICLNSALPPPPCPSLSSPQA